MARRSPGSASSSGASTAPVSPPERQQRIGRAPSSAAMRATHTPWPAACTCTSSPSPRDSIATLSRGSGPNTATGGWSHEAITVQRTVDDATREHIGTNPQSCAVLTHTEGSTSHQQTVAEGIASFHDDTNKASVKRRQTDAPSVGASECSGGSLVLAGVVPSSVALGRAPAAGETRRSATSRTTPVRRRRPRVTSATRRCSAST